MLLHKNLQCVKSNNMNHYKPSSWNKIATANAESFQMLVINQSVRLI